MSRHRHQDGAHEKDYDIYLQSPFAPDTLSDCPNGQ